MKDTSLIISSDCPKVDGFLRSCIYDLTRERYFLCKKTNNLFNLEKDFIDFLIQQEIFIKIPFKAKNRFRKIKFEYDTYNLISSCYVEVLEIRIFDLFLKILCRDFALKIDNYKKNRKKLYQLLKYLNNSIINSIEIHIIDNDISIDELEDISSWSDDFSFTKFFVYSDNEKIISDFYNNGIKSVVCNSLDSFQNNKDIRNNFFINIRLFSESQKHNTYYNKKVFIKKNGDVKNSFNGKSTICNIFDVKNTNELINIISSSKAQKYWHIHKDIVDICRDCEFRHMCVDDCFLKKRKDGSWHRSEECYYNPYIAKWKGEDGYQTLEECGVICNSKEFKIDKKKLNSINKKLWVEA